MKQGQKVTLVRFGQHVSIGKELDMNSYLMDGQRVREAVVRLSAHDATFLEVRFECAKPYLQLIPWAAVATVQIDL